MPVVTPAPVLSPFDPIDLGKHLRRQRENGVYSPDRPFVTFLVGAGFSFSAGIPVAGKIVEELEKEIADDPLLRKTAESPCKEGVSRYAHLMEALGTPKERARRIRAYVDRARDSVPGPLKINWAHLLLATMVKHGYVTRILTTNFDPLVVEALALTGQPIRTFDLNTTGHYDSDILENGTVVYLHGQMHSLLLANTTSETQNIQQHYRGVLQEAIRDSYLIVVGYSGDCDPVLDALKNLITFPCGLWWSHYGTVGPGKGVQEIFAKHANACHLATGDDADLFMRKLVLDGMGLPRPDEIVAPFSAMERSLLRIVSPLPTSSTPSAMAPEPDQVANSLALIRKAIDEASATAPSAERHPKKSRTTDPNRGKPRMRKAKPENLHDLQLVVRVSEAVTTDNWSAFDRLVATITPDPSSPVSRAMGDGWVRRAGASLDEKNADDALRYLESARRYGVSSGLKAWLPTLTGNAHVLHAKRPGHNVESDGLFAKAFAHYAEAVRQWPTMHQAFNNWGNALVAQAKLKGSSPEADRLFADASAKYAEAARLKPDGYQAFNNWGNALAAQAKLKGASPEADHFFANAYAKYAEALRIKPDYHEALFNWGTWLSEQANSKGNSPDANRLFADAGVKFAEAVRIKPDNHEAFFNWGAALSDQAKLKGNSPEADRLLTDAGSKFAEALRIRPENHKALVAWGIVLSKRAKLKGNSPEADRLFKDSGLKFAEALHAWPENHEALINWGAALSDQAKLKGDSPEADRLFDEAATKITQGIHTNPSNSSARFNLACLAALQGKLPDCLAALAKWREHDPAATRRKIDGDSDFDSVRDQPEFRAFRAALP